MRRQKRWTREKRREALNNMGRWGSVWRAQEANSVDAQILVCWFVTADGLTYRME